MEGKLIENVGFVLVDYDIVLKGTEIVRRSGKVGVKVVDGKAVFDRYLLIYLDEEVILRCY